MDLSSFFPSGNFAWAEFKDSGHCSRTSGNPARAVTSAKMMDIQKCKRNVSQACTDQLYSTSTISSTGHMPQVSCTVDLLQMHRPSVLHTSIYFRPGNPGQKQDYLNSLFLSPFFSTHARAYSCLPVHVLTLSGLAGLQWAASLLSSAKPRARNTYTALKSQAMLQLQTTRLS